MNHINSDAEHLKSFNRFFFRMIAGAALFHILLAGVVAYNI